MGKVLAPLKEKGILTVHITGAPGSGKTSLLKKIAARLDTTRIGIIMGDPTQAPEDNDINHPYTVVEHFNTADSAVLDSDQIKKPIEKFRNENIVMIFIENVGNLIFPPDYTLGEDLNMIVYSVTDGMDKPRKYFNAFSKAHVIVVNKIDLLPHINFKTREFEKILLNINPGAQVFYTSALNGKGIYHLTRWFYNRITPVKKAVTT